MLVDPAVDVDALSHVGNPHAGRPAAVQRVDGRGLRQLVPPSQDEGHASDPLSSAGAKGAGRRYRYSWRSAPGPPEPLDPDAVLEVTVADGTQVEPRRRPL